MAVPTDPVALAALGLARQAVEHYVGSGRLVDPPADLPPVLRERSGTFVTLRALGKLRGCIGTLAPTRPDIAREIIACAVAAARHDPRFPPVRLDELARLAYEVDLVGSLQPVEGPHALDPRLYGVLVEADTRRGVLLPDLDGVDTAEQQIAIARRKAGLAPDAPVQLYRFAVRRFVEEAAAR
jgi:AmmeMemoRadiSam system protein A